MPGISEQRTALRSRRRTSLRTGLLLLVLVPGLALAGLWGYAASSLVSEALGLRSDVVLVKSAAQPAHKTLIRLQDERRATTVWQARPSASRGEMDRAREETDAAVRDLRAGLDGGLGEAGSQARKLAGIVDDSLEELTGQREAIDKRAQAGISGFTYYTETADRLVDLFQELTHSDDGSFTRGGNAVAALASGHETLSRQDALLSAGLRSGRLSSAAHEKFADYAAAHEHIRSSLNTHDLPPAQAAEYDRVTSGGQWKAVLSIQQAVSDSGSGLPSQAGAWRAAASQVVGDLRITSAEGLAAVADEGSSRGDRLLLTALGGTVLGIAALALGLLFAVRFARSLLSRITGLRDEAVDLAGGRLPDLMGRLARGERVDQGAFAFAALDYGHDEVGQLAEALQNTCHTVMGVTIQQTQGREGTKKVFVNLARRTQVLIHRQISMLDTMERRHEDPELLEDLFAVDHLATRVRRHAENLVILGGSLPARRWSDAVPVVNVLRSALSETEAYTRVKVLPVPRLNLVGQAVADVVHLVAELIENGTSFSPPDTQVSVGAEKVTKGLVIEVEDRGLGLPDKEYRRINALLAEPPELDMMALGEDPRLGLFVVARLAGRHGVEVSLRKSPYGGTLALVLLPNPLLEEPKVALAGIPGLPIAARAQEGQPREEGARASLFPFPRVHQRGEDQERGAEIRSFPEQRAAAGPPEPVAPAPVHTEMPGSESTSLREPAEGAHTRPVEEEAAQDTSARTTRPRVLPKRVRQASLVDQLREAAKLPPPPEPQPVEEEPAQPSPQQAGATMAAIQRETRRARETDTMDPGDSQAPRSENPGHDAGRGSSVGKEEG